MHQQDIHIVNEPPVQCSQQNDRIGGVHDQGRGNQGRQMDRLRWDLS